MVIYTEGIRYWATKGRHPLNGRPCLIFWSSHKWPFFHAYYQPDWLRDGQRVTEERRGDAWHKLKEFIPST